MDKAAKAEARIKAVCDRMGITEGGRKWIDVALDPFKDIEQKPIGYPDRNMAPTVIQTVHESFEVNRESGNTGNWDCNIFIDQMWKTTELKKTTTYLTEQILTQDSQTGVGFCRGGIVVRQANSGLPLGMETTKNQMCKSLVTDVFDNDTSTRLIAIGLEVHNTTAELYKQGSVICYKISDDPMKLIYTPIPDPTVVRVPVPCMGVELVEPPQTAGQAIDLPGSVQWDAVKGCYIVPTFAKESNDPTDLRVLPSVAVDSLTGDTYANNIYVVGNLVYFTDKNVELPTTMAGAYFTGLSEQSTLQINITYYLEQFPSFQSPMHRISTKSCPEDFAAVELYTKVVREMPAGVEVNDNFLGAFVSGVSRVMQFVSKAAPTIARGIGIAGQVMDVLSPDKASDHMNSLVTRPQRTQQLVPQRLLNAPSRDIIIKEPNNRQLVIHEGPAKGVQRQNFNNPNRNRVVKNRRDKDFNRLDKYIKAGTSGNKYIQ